MTVFRNADGFSNRSLTDGIGQTMPVLDPTKYIVYWDDFVKFTAADWTITTTEAGAGDASEAITNGHGGLLLITNDAADNDNDFLQAVGEAFRFTAGKKAWFEARIKTSDATDSDIVVGLQITDTSPLAVTDGIYFLKADDATSVTFYVTKDSVSTTSGSVATMANDTWIKLGFYYDGSSAIQVWVNDALADTVATNTLPNDEDLTVSFGIQNGAAAAKTLTVDYILAMMER